jgi:hypothetical protein
VDFHDIGIDNDVHYRLNRDQDHSLFCYIPNLLNGVAVNDFVIADDHQIDQIDQIYDQILLPLSKDCYRYVPQPIRHEDDHDPPNRSFV